MTLLALHVGAYATCHPSVRGQLSDAGNAAGGLVTCCTTKTTSGFSRALRPFKQRVFIGRALGYPIALEGAQKLKEISYIHAEAYPHPLKYGPFMLVTEETPTAVDCRPTDCWTKLSAPSKKFARVVDLLSRWAAMTHASGIGKRIFVRLKSWRN